MDPCSCGPCMYKTEGKAATSSQPVWASRWGTHNNNSSCRNTLSRVVLAGIAFYRILQVFQGHNHLRSSPHAVVQSLPAAPASV
jgi:hypothetical protein